MDWKEKEVREATNLFGNFLLQEQEAIRVKVYKEETAT